MRYWWRRVAGIRREFGLGLVEAIAVDIAVRSLEDRLAEMPDDDARVVHWQTG